MKKKLIVTIAIAALLLCGSRICVASMTNGSFESGLTGWSVILPPNGSAKTVTNYVTEAEDLCPTGTTSWTSTNGSYFALLKPNGSGSQSLLFQSFTASAGDVLTLDYFWDSQDYKPYDDSAIGKILSGAGPYGSEVTTLFAHSVNTDPQDEWGTPWMSVGYTFTAAGSYTLLIKITNVGDSACDSRVGVDNVNMATMSDPVSRPVPAPSAILLGGIGISFVSWLRRRRSL